MFREPPGRQWGQAKCRKWVGVRPDRKIRAEREDQGEDLFVVAVGLFSSCGEQGLLFVAVCGRLIMVTLLFRSRD